MRSTIRKSIILELTSTEAAALLVAIRGGQYDVDINSPERNHVDDAIEILEEFIEEENK